jgi:hypothetical protein
LGKWERDNFGKPVAAVLEEAMEVASTVRVVRTVAVVGAAGAAIGATYVAWRIGKSLYGWVDDAKDLIPVAAQMATTPAQFRWLRALGIGDGKGVI